MFYTMFFLIRHRCHISDLFQRWFFIFVITPRRLERSTCQRMKYTFLFIITIVLFACNNHGTDTKMLQADIDSLQNKLDNSYKPGLGEFMSNIQLHHTKLWFAGQNQNWKLADFEINEIKETIANIKEYCPDRVEVKSIGIIDPAIDSISNAVHSGNSSQFKNSYVLLTTTCNNCHQSTEHSFNVIKIPDSPPFSDQDFKKK